MTYTAHFVRYTFCDSSVFHDSSAGSVMDTVNFILSDGIYNENDTYEDKIVITDENGNVVYRWSEDGGTTDISDNHTYFEDTDEQDVYIDSCDISISFIRYTYCCGRFVSNAKNPDFMEFVNTIISDGDYDEYNSYEDDIIVTNDCDGSRILKWTEANGLVINN